MAEDRHEWHIVQVLVYLCVVQLEDNEEDLTGDVPHQRLWVVVKLLDDG